MYRCGREYDRMCNLVADVYEDYGITKDSFPLDMDYWGYKIGIDLIPYSAFPDKIDLLLKKSDDAFCVPSDGKYNPAIVFNDIDLSFPSSKIASNKGHELKHILDGDVDDSEDDLADYFSKYFRCPMPYVIYLNISTTYELCEKFKISNEQANYVLDNANKRIRKYGHKYFEYEIRLLRQLLKDDFDKDRISIINNYGGGINIEVNIEK